MKDNQLIQEVKEALSKATPGKWIYEHRQGGGQVTTDQEVTSFFDLGHWICQLWYKDESPMTNHEANGVLIANAPEMLRSLVDALEEANRENADMKKLLMDVSEHLSWRNVDGSGPAKALGMIYTWAALSLKEDKTDD